MRFAEKRIGRNPTHTLMGDHCPFLTLQCERERIEANSSSSMNIAANSRRISGGNEMKEQSEIDDGLIHCKLYVYDMSICQPVISGNKPARQLI